MLILSFTALPVAYFIEIYGCGSVTVLASMVAAVSLFVSFFLNSLILLYISLGAATGRYKDKYQNFIALASSKLKHGLIFNLDF